MLDKMLSGVYSRYMKATKAPQTATAKALLKIAKNETLCSHLRWLAADGRKDELNGAIISALIIHGDATTPHHNHPVTTALMTTDTWHGTASYWFTYATSTLGL